MLFYVQKIPDYYVPYCVSRHLELIPHVSRLKKLGMIAYTWVGVSTHGVRLAFPNQFTIHMVKCETKVRVLRNSSKGGQFVRDSKGKSAAEWAGMVVRKS